MRKNYKGKLRNKLHGNNQYWCFYRGKKSGKSVLELISALFIFTMVTFIITAMFTNNIGHYLKNRKLDHSQIAIQEALMYIDYYINYYGENYYVEDARLYIEGKDGGRKNYIYLNGDELRVAYKNQTGTGYTSQPLLYEVEELKLFQNGRVVFMEISIKGGYKMKKSLGRI